MEKSKLIKIIEKLNTREKRRFREFIQSSFYNKNVNLIKLFEIIDNHVKAYIKGKKGMKDAFELLFPGEKYNAQKFRYAMSDLTKLLERFLAEIEFENKPLYLKHLLLNAYNHKNLDKYFDAELRSAKEKITSSKIKDTEYYYYNFLYEYDQYNYSAFKNNRQVDRNLKNVIDNLELFYLSNQLKFHCEAVNRRNILAVDTDSLDTEHLLMLVNKSKFKNEPIIFIYQNILKTLIESENENHYKTLTSLLNKYHKNFPVEELKDMYGFLLNYCIKQLNFGNSSYLNELFSIYNQLLDKKIIFEGKYITPHHLKNIVTVGLRLHEFDKTEEIIKKYQNSIEKQHRENVYNFNMALLYFYKKQFGNTLKYLHSSNFNDIYYQLDARVLLLKTYYELNETEPLFSLVDSFKIFLKRNRSISEYQKTIYFNFVNFANILTKQSLYKKYDIQKIISNIRQTKKVADINWLLEKAEKLKN